MQSIKAIIADDEEHLRTYLKTRLTSIWPELSICAEAENGRDALILIEQQKPDIAFLDIKMPGVTGMDVAEKIADGCHVVFITAYEQFAIDAFENQAIDYILKPVTSERLLSTVKRLKRHLSTDSKPEADLSGIIDLVANEVARKTNPEYIKWIKAQHRDTIRLIPVDEIYYFQSNSKYTSVFTKTGESLIRKPIKELTSELDPDVFWQIHRGTIINANRIEKVSHSLTGRLAVKLGDISEILVVSRSYSHLFKHM